MSPLSWCSKCINAEESWEIMPHSTFILNKTAALRRLSLLILPRCRNREQHWWSSTFIFIKVCWNPVVTALRPHITQGEWKQPEQSSILYFCLSTSVRHKWWLFCHFITFYRVTRFLLIEEDNVIYFCNILLTLLAVLARQSDLYPQHKELGSYQHIELWA